MRMATAARASRTSFGIGLFRQGLGRAVPIGRRRVDAEISDALAIERIKVVEARGIHLLAFASEAFRRLPILGAEAREKLGVAVGELDETVRLLEGLVAEQGEDASRLGFALHLQEVELEKGELRRARGGGLADHRAHIISLGLSFEPRRDVDVVADHRIIEARLRAEIADAANAGIEPDAEPHRLELPALGFRFL